MKNSLGLMNKVNIIYSCNDFVVAEKAHNLATAPLSENETQTALNYVLELFPEGRDVCGKKPVEHGLIHRLDTATHGLFLVALNQSSFDNLWKQQKDGLFIKKYTAYCTKQLNDSFPICNYQLQKNLKIKSYFRYFGPKNREVRPVALDGTSGKAAAKNAQNKIYETLINDFSKINFAMKPFYKDLSIYKIDCLLKSGFKHQLRSHLAWLGFPIIGDGLYCPTAKMYQEEKDGSFNLSMELHATFLSFTHPFTSEQCTFSLNDKADFYKDYDA